MLEGLDAVDWTTFSHAHGVASDVPSMLYSLISPDEEEKLNACDDLHQTIWHQGTIYSASAAVLPFLFEIIQHKAQFTRPDGDFQPTPDEVAVSLICCITTGNGWVQHHLHSISEDGVRERFARLGRSFENELLQEKETLDSIRKHVSEHLRLLLPYLGSPESLGVLVCEAISNFPEHSVWLTQDLENALAMVSDEAVRAAIIETKAKLSPV